MRQLLLFLLLVTFAFSMNAQSTYDSPWVGATHHYVATVTDAGNNNPVRWWVATDAAGNTKAAYTTVYEFDTLGYDAGDDRFEDIAVYSVPIKWASSLNDGDIFFVVFEVDDDVSNCTNRMTMQVEIEAAFNALVWDVTGSATPGTVIVDGGAGDDTVDPTCPDPVQNPLWDGVSHTDIGNSEIVFRVNKQNTLLDWQFEFEISEGTAQSFSIDSIRFEDDLGGTLAVANQTGDLTGGDVSVNSTEDWVLAYVYIRNQQGITLDINFDLITTNNLTRDAGNNLDSVPGDNSAGHTIQPMPVITNFGGN
jgi:hypothetical protein